MDGWMDGWMDGDDDDDDDDDETVTSTPNRICQKQKLISSPLQKNSTHGKGGGVAAPGGEEGLCVCLPVMLACRWPPAYRWVTELAMGFSGKSLEILQDQSLGGVNCRENGKYTPANN